MALQQDSPTKRQIGLFNHAGLVYARLLNAKTVRRKAYH
jgi:hypothetical protein